MYKQLLGINDKNMVVLALLALIVIYLVIQKTSNAVKDIFSDEERREIDRENYIKVSSNINNSKLSYPDDAYSNFASILMNAMSGAGTDEEAIREVFKKMNNNDDVRMLIKTFGTIDGDNLFTWIDKDLSRSSMFGLSINDINEMLGNKGITIIF